MVAIASVLGVLGAFKALGVPDEIAGLLDTATGELFGQQGKAILDKVQVRLRAYSGEVPPNHDLEQVLRLADLTASLVLLERFARPFTLVEHDSRTDPAPPFIEKARAFLFNQIGLTPSLETKPNDALVTELNFGLDRVLHITSREVVEQGLVGARDASWSALIAGAGKAPPDFEALFHGQEAGEPGWSITVLAFVREALKANPRVETDFVTTRLASLREVLQRTEGQLTIISGVLAKLLAFAEEDRKRRGIAEGFVHEMAGRIAASPNLDLDGKMQAVRGAIALYAEEVAGGSTRTNLGEIVDTALARAKGLADDGKSGLARASLRKAAEKLRREDEARRQDESERRARYVESVRVLYGRERDIALAAFDGVAAAEAIVAMAEAVGACADCKRSILKAEAETQFAHGLDRGSNVHLIAAIELRRRLLGTPTSADERGAVLNNLGVALYTLGERESGTTRLNEAVAAYGLALEESARERVPLQWATTQNNLGNALYTLGERESGTARFEAAVAAYGLALEESTRERVPLQWATTQNNLGATLSTLGERESCTARLADAVAAFRSALEEFTRERVPLQWAMTQNNLGNALYTLGERESGTARLADAAAAYRLALEERTRERVPLEWATTQNNLGNALKTLGERESGTARLEEAVAACCSALEEWTRERVPLDWAMAQTSFGNALRAIGEREGSMVRLEDAVAAYRSALEEFTEDQAPHFRQETIENLASAQRLLNERRAAKPQ